MEGCCKSHTQLSQHVEIIRQRTCSGANLSSSPAMVAACCKSDTLPQVQGRLRNTRCGTWLSLLGTLHLKSRMVGISKPSPSNMCETVAGQDSAAPHDAVTALRSTAAFNAACWVVWHKKQSSNHCVCTTKKRPAALRQSGFLLSSAPEAQACFCSNSSCCLTHTRTGQLASGVSWPAGSCQCAYLGLRAAEKPCWCALSPPGVHGLT